ncbi:MAG: tRNA (N6-isopentenyl adenosine(37)-C2)-methylthiotransferase MiaB [Candidatus Goldiibacteriota bacterium]|jgi:tRNA-2-methylthio-N6-dimethylallyladenosine synthase
MKKVFIKTFGCQMNVYDSERMAGELAAGGYELCADGKEAEFVIVNTCSVRAHAEDRATSYIGAAVKDKKVIVAGCMAERMKESIIKKFPRLYAVVGTFNFSNIAEILERPKTKLFIENVNERYTKNLKRSDKVRGSITIMQGCDNFCTYCIVPYVRGRERSRDAASIIQELEIMAGQGFKEALFLGQNVNSYLDAASGDDFAGLLKKAAEVSGIERLRFMTSHPKDLSDDLIGAIAGINKVCKHIHLPLQSGSDRILKAMNRKYTAEWYKSRVARIRSAMPGVSVTTDILVGFPGETEADFMETAEMAEKCRFDAAYIFKYSVRKGTAAEKLADDVPEKEKLRRLNYVLELEKKIGEDITKSLIGGELEVLFYSPAMKEPGMMEGTTPANRKVITVGGASLAGTLKTVKITGAKGAILTGEILK